MDKDFKCLPLESLLSHDVLMVLKTLTYQYHARHKRWMSGELFDDWLYMNLIENFTYLRERQPQSSIIALLTRMLKILNS